MAISLAYPSGEEGGHFTWFYLLSHRLEEVGNISISYVLKTGNIKTTCPLLLFCSLRMDGLGSLQTRFTGVLVLCLFDLEIRLAAPPSTIFLFHFSVALKWMEREKKGRLISRLPFIPVIFFLGLVWFSCIIVAK